MKISKETPRLTLIPQSNAVLESYRNTYHITVTSQSAILPNTVFSRSGHAR